MNSLPGSNLQYLVTIRINLIQIRPNSLGKIKYRSYLVINKHFMLSVTNKYFRLNVIILNVIRLNDIKMNIIMLNVVKLRFFTMSVVEPLRLCEL